MSVQEFAIVEPGAAGCFGNKGSLVDGIHIDGLHAHAQGQIPTASPKPTALEDTPIFEALLVHAPCHGRHRAGRHHQNRAEAYEGRLALSNHLNEQGALPQIAVLGRSFLDEHLDLAAAPKLVQPARHALHKRLHARLRHDGATGYDDNTATARFDDAYASRKRRIHRRWHCLGRAIQLLRQQPIDGQDDQARKRITRFIACGQV